jgi:thiol-disulfide isomerase/thioredoxin
MNDVKKMKTAPLFSLLFFVLSSCTHKNSTISYNIIIEGHVKNIPDGKVYLTDALQWKTPVDSAECINGHFVFKIKTDSSFVPFLAAIHFADSSKQAGISRLVFRNYTLGADSMKYSRDVFFLEKGTTTMEGDNTASPFLRIFAGRETELLFQNQFTDFGWLGTIDPEKRLLAMEGFKKQIRQHPFSYFLLQNIYASKEQYSNPELKDFLSLFSSDVQQSKPGIQLSNYLSFRPDPGSPYPVLMLLSPDNKQLPVIDTGAKLNMLVFWASWCSPCIKEIPLLKDIQRKYAGKGLHIVSISIDKNKEQWKKALAQEKMSWQQLIIGNEMMEKTMALFGFVTIPLVIFTEGSGVEIKRIPDYDPENKKLYEAVVARFIALK